MPKKIISIILAMTFIIMVLPISAYATDISSDRTEDATVADIENAMGRVSLAVENIPELKNVPELKSAFDSFTKVCGYVSAPLTVINGSANFLKLIGVVEDGASAKMDSVIEQIVTINDKMNDMSKELNNIASQMTVMQASMEFNHRGDMAATENGFWRDFSYNYMENSMDSLMSEYDAMVINGIKQWCNNASISSRFYNDIDNTKVIIVYAEDEDGNESVVNFIGNKVPEDVEYTKYVIISADCIPEHVTFDVDNFHDDISSAIAEKIKENISAGNYEVFESQNFPMFTKEGKADATDEAINKVAEGAANVIAYRAAASEVNEDARFARKVNDAFNNYCNHLASSEDGIDAMLNTIYLTHSFEFEAREDIENFLNRMTLKTGVYGSFVSNVNGMSNTIGKDAKMTAVNHLCDAIEYIDQAMKNGIKGAENFCYITGTKVEYTTARVNVKAQMKYEKIHSGHENYKSCSADPITVTFDTEQEQYGIIGDVNYMLLYYTMKSSKVDDIEEYLIKHTTVKAKTIYMQNYGYILTSYGSEQNLALDGAYALNAYNTLGNDFEGVKTFKLTSNEDDYPDDAEPEYIVYHKKLCGNVFNVKTATLNNNVVLNAIAIYGQTHSYWFLDEAAFFSGGNSGSIYYGSANEHKEEVKSGVYNCTNNFFSYTDFNTLILAPVQNAKFGGTVSVDGYNPLESFKNICDNGTREPEVESTSGLNIAFAVCGIGLAVIAIIRKKG